MIKYIQSLPWRTVLWRDGLSDFVRVAQVIQVLCVSGANPEGRCTFKNSLSGVWTTHWVHLTESLTTFISLFTINSHRLWVDDVFLVRNSSWKCLVLLYPSLYGSSSSSTCWAWDSMHYIPALIQWTWNKSLDSASWAFHFVFLSLSGSWPTRRMGSGHWPQSLYSL